MKVSVAIPTKDRQNHLKIVLADLLKQDYNDFEILIADQSKDIYNESIIKHDKILYFHLDFTGLTRVRNFLVDKSNGEIIIFIDDDVRIEDPNFIKYHVQCYKDNDDIAGVAGRIIDHRFNKLTGKRKILTLNIWGKVEASKNDDRAYYVDMLPGGNMSFYKKLFYKAGGFSTNIIGNAVGEDLDFSLRLAKKTGKRFLYCPNASLIHLAFNSGGCDNRKNTELCFRIFRAYNLGYIFSKSKKNIFIFFFIHQIIQSLYFSFKYRSIAYSYRIISAVITGLIKSIYNNYKGHIKLLRRYHFDINIK